MNSSNYFYLMVVIGLQLYGFKELVFLSTQLLLQVTILNTNNLIIWCRAFQSNIKFFKQIYFTQRWDSKK